MFNQGLSLDQAPPISVIMRFFLTIPFFGILTALAIIFSDSHMLGAWDQPHSVAVVHLVMLGIAAMAMVGALFQMLPVIAGAPISEPLYHARWIHLLLILGTLMISAAFYFNIYTLMHPAVPLLLGTFGFVIYLMLTKLFAVENKTSSVKGMIVSLLSLGVGSVFALLLTAIFMGADLGLDPLLLRSVHVRFMLLGWVGVLVMAVAFQVIEMFYVTPSYLKYIRLIFPLGVLFLLLLHTVSLFLDSALASVADILLALLFLVFAAVTIKRLMQRKRPVADATVWLWRSAMLSLAFASLFFMLHTVTGYGWAGTASALLYAYFILSVIFAMSYKIVPFLVWFHLNAKGVIETPMMGDIIPSKSAMLHLWLHWALFAAGVGLFFTPYAWKVVGAVIAVESILYGINLFGAMKIYNSLKDKGHL